MLLLKGTLVARGMADEHLILVLHHFAHTCKCIELYTQLRDRGLGDDETRVSIAVFLSRV